MPAKHPCVVQLEFCGFAIYIPAIAVIKRLRLSQPEIQLGSVTQKAQLATHRLIHGSEQHPVIGVSSFAIDLSQPVHDLRLLGAAHPKEDPLAAEPDSD